MKGREYVESPTLIIAKCFEDSATNLPLLFVLSSGTDPMEDFVRFAESVSKSSIVNEYGLFQPIGPNFLLSRITAWKKHKQNTIFLNSFYLVLTLFNL
jgi:dynein heavy chain